MMATKKKTRKHSKAKIPVLATAGAAAYGFRVYQGYAGKLDSQGGYKGLQWGALGINNAGKFQMSEFIEAVTPLAVGVGGSMLASKFKVNRYLSGIPLFKL